VSGPDINRPRPGSNAIGKFIIGVSPIGDIPSFDFWITIISQYANSPIITQLIANFDSYVDQTINLQSFFDLMWNVDTAIGYGLDVWGRIVGVTRTLEVGGTLTYFDFEESGLSGNGFGQQPFYDGAPINSNFQLSDNAFRTLIFAKALANISDGSIKSLNQILINLFPARGNAFVTDGLNMTMTYTFKFQLTAVELAIVSQSGVLPKPTGVSLTIVEA
jgi:hypothetical protein